MAGTGASERPRQLVIAGGVVVVASVMLVASVFDSLGGLQSVATRQHVGEVVGSSSGKQLGITVDQVLAFMRVGFGATAVLAAVAAVLGVYVLLQHRGARVGLTVVAVPLLLLAVVLGNLLGLVVAVAVATLWTAPVRAWFDGRPLPAPPVRRTAEPSAPPPAPPPVVAAPPPHAPAPEPPRTTAPSAVPPPTAGYGATPLSPHTTSYLAAPPPVPHAARRAPSGVVAACLLAMVFSGLVALLYAATAVALVTDHDQVLRLVTDTTAFRRSGLPKGSMLGLLWFGTVLFLAWSLGAVVLGFLALRRHNWARITLLVSAGVAFVAALFAFPLGIFHQLACLGTFWGLLDARARGWYSRQQPPPPSGPPTGPPAAPRDQPSPPERRLPW